MLRLMNCGHRAFLRYAQGKTAYVYGAGRALESCLDLYFHDQDVAAIIDGNPKLWGRIVHHHGKGVPVLSPEAFATKMARGGRDQALLMVTSPFYAAEIVEALDRVPEFDGLACFLQAVVRETLEPVPPFTFSQGPQRIPKKIHYIWFGGKPLPERYKRNIETWRKYNPDFEIIRWDESNYDLHRHHYAEQAYESGALSFASNLARLDILQEQGGIYLDTDVEVRQSFAPLLADRAFFGMSETDRVSNGCGFGAAPHQNIIGDMIAAFDARPFLRSNGRPEKRPCHAFLHPVLRRYGFRMVNEYQNIDGIALYPTEVLSPLRMYGLPDGFTEQTIAVHRQDRTWQNERERQGNERVMELVKRMEFLKPENYGGTNGNQK